MAKTFLITGANRGIGFEMTRQATLQGNRVFACTRNTTESSDLVALANQHDGITVLGLDVCAEKDMKHIADGIKHPIDILVCNAGVLNSYGGLQDPDHDTASIANVLMTNILYRYRVNVNHNIIMNVYLIHLKMINIKNVRYVLHLI